MPRIIKPAKGSFTSASITVDSSGRIVSASSGTAGDQNIFPTWIAQNGTYTAQPGTNKIYVYAVGGGGGGGGPFGQGRGNGGTGGAGLAVIPVSAPYTATIVSGSGGSGTNGPGQGGQAGQASTLDTNTVVANAGNGGSGRGSSPGNTGNFSVASPATELFDYSPLGLNSRLLIYGGDTNNTAKGGPGQGAGASGGRGAVVIYEPLE